MKNWLNKASGFIICTIIYTLFLSPPAYSEENSHDKWKFQIAPYVWLAGQKGTVSTLPGLPPADVDLDFYDDIYDDLNGALMIVGEARKGSYGVYWDFSYVDIETEDSTPGPFFSSITSRTKSWNTSIAGFYRLVEKDRQFIDALGGIRYWSVDSKLSLGAGWLAAREISNKEDWFDPIIGLKGFSPLWESKFFISGILAIGGFNVGSDFMWDATINFGYQWTKGFSTTIGYRYMSVDYEDGDFLYDVAQDGLILGLSWRF